MSQLKPSTKGLITKATNRIMENPWGHFPTDGFAMIRRALQNEMPRQQAKHAARKLVPSIEASFYNQQDRLQEDMA